VENLLKYNFKLTKRELILEDIFYTLTNLIRDAIIVADSSRKIVFWNKASERIFGYSSAEVLAKSISVVLPQDILANTTGSKSDSKDKYIEAVGRNKAGRKIPLEISKTYWESEKGQFFTLILRDVTARKSTEEKLKYLSFHDNLTGLYNRSYFDEELKRLDTKRQLPLSVIICDIDGFKLVNDAFGYKEGDELLKGLSKILKKSCRSEDILARWGGDEFVILLPKTDIKGIQDIICRIESKISAVGSGEIPFNISLGYSIKEKPLDSIETVLKEAETSMKQKKLLRSKKVSSDIIASIEKKLHEKSAETRETYDRIKKLALAIGRSLKLQKADMDNLALFSDFHDIGKAAIKASILNKKAKLVEKEWQIMKMHPEIGYRIAKSSTELALIADAILAHHENWDGTGYPYHLKGLKIPVAARIIAVVEAYDVMTKGRSYKKPISREEAIDELNRNSKKQFDPRIVNSFVELMKLKEDNLSLFPE
jgi:diguanylate cyclase (GGDEF)-like protein/PAS domain S-box-containing protein